MHVYRARNGKFTSICRSRVSGILRRLINCHANRRGRGYFVDALFRDNDQRSSRRNCILPLPSRPGQLTTHRARTFCFVIAISYRTSGPFSPRPDDELRHEDGERGRAIVIGINRTQRQRFERYDLQYRRESLFRYGEWRLMRHARER